MRYKRILVVAAVSDELHLLREYLGCGVGTGSGVDISCYLGREIYLVECGIGLVNAVLVTSRACALYCPDIVVSIGTCGLLSGSDDDVGRPVLVSRSFQWDEDHRIFGYSLYDTAEGAAVDGPGWLDGIGSVLGCPVVVGVSGAGAVYGVDGDRIREMFPCAAVVDSETYGVMRAASSCGVDTFGVRCPTEVVGGDTSAYGRTSKLVSDNAARFAIRMLVELDGLI